MFKPEIYEFVAAIRFNGSAAVRCVRTSDSVSVRQEGDWFYFTGTNGETTKTHSHNIHYILGREIEAPAPVDTKRKK